MSASEPARAESAADALERLASACARATIEPVVIDERVLVRIVSAAVKLFSRACEGAGYELAPVDATVSTTEAVRLAVALAKSQDLSPFDLSLWFGRGSRGIPADASTDVERLADGR